MTTALLLQHLGPLHRGEQVLVYLLAFGPFVLLGLVVWISRRRDAALGAAPGVADQSAGDGLPPAGERLGEAGDGPQDQR